MQLYAYTGELTLLKGIGYRFQKLYAKNHKTYIKDKMFLFVIEGMVLEYSRIDDEIQKITIDFILKNKDENKDFWMSQGKFGSSAKYCVTRFGNLMLRSDYTKNRVTYYDDMNDFIDKESSGKYSKDDIDKIYETIDAKEFSRDPYYIDIKFINLVIELNNLHPLEVITVSEN